MKTIELQVNEELYAKLGERKLKQRLQKEVEYLYYECTVGNPGYSSIIHNKQSEIADTQMYAAWEQMKKDLLKTTS